MAHRRIRLGIIGTGIAARDLHWPPLHRQSDHFEIVAVCNHTRPKAEAFAQLTGQDPRITTDYHDLLAAPDIEAVDIVLPIALNAPVAIDALRGGKHVIVEKPIAGDVVSGEAVVAEAHRRPEQILLVAENMRYEPRIRRAREVLDAGRIGRVVMLHADVLSPLDPENPYTQTAWRQQPEHLGGYLSDGGVHQVAVLQMLAGPVTTVQGLVTSFHSGEDVPDTMLANLRFATGAVGHLTYATDVHRREQSPLRVYHGVASQRVGHGNVHRQEQSPVRVYGTEGTLEIHEDRMVLSNGDGDQEIPCAGGPTGLDQEFADFYTCVTTGKRPDVAPEDALRDLEVIDAAIRSSRYGEVVEL